MSSCVCFCCSIIWFVSWFYPWLWMDWILKHVTFLHTWAGQSQQSLTYNSQNRLILGIHSTLNSLFFTKIHGYWETHQITMTHSVNLSNPPPPHTQFWYLMGTLTEGLDLLPAWFHALNCCHVIAWLVNCINVQVFLLKWTVCLYFCFLVTITEC